MIKNLAKNPERCKGKLYRRTYVPNKMLHLAIKIDKEVH